MKGRVEIKANTCHFRQGGRKSGGAPAHPLNIDPVMQAKLAPRITT